MKEYQELSVRELLNKALDTREDSGPLLEEADRRDRLMTEELAAVVGKKVSAEWTPVGEISLDDGTYQIACCIRHTPKTERPSSEPVRSLNVEPRTTNHKLGVYFAPTHGRARDRSYIESLQPPVIRLLDPDVQQLADMHKLAPNAILAPRTWVIDDNNGAAVRSLMSDPVATGHDHAHQYRNQLERWDREARERGLTLPPADRIYFNAANEPNQGGTPEKIAEYNIAFLDRCTEFGIRACGLVLGVGWPGNDGPGTPVNWTPYVGVVDAIRRGHHWLELHEYFYKSGPQDGWLWWAGRHLQCPFDVPILLGEIGIDNYVDAQRWNKEGGNRGWRGNVSPDSYAGMIEQHVRGSDNRVVAALPFLTDFRDRGWESFDTGEAHVYLLARKDKMVPQVSFGGKDTPPVEPPVPTGSNWEKGIEFVLRMEGGFQNNPEDTGNYYNGQLIGTKYGISAATWGGQYDIPNLTIEQAKEIYHKHYWLASKANEHEWPLSLLIFDSAVLHGVSAASRWLSEVGANPYLFAAKRLRIYTSLANWSVFGRGWVNRVSALLEEIGG